MNLSTNPLFTHGIDKLCIICHVILKETDRTYSIFSTLEQLESPMNLLQVLQSFSNFNFYIGPQMVCTTCYDKTIDVYKFIQMCNTASENIQHYLQNVEPIKTIKNETDVDAKIEEIYIAPTRINIDGREFLEEMENENICKFDEFGMVISGTDIKIEESLLEEGMEKEETTNYEEVTISHTEIVSEEKHNSQPQQAFISKDLRLNQDRHRHQPLKDHESDALECQEMFNNDNQLKIRMRRSHKKEFLCNDCGKVFTTKSHLDTHIHVHTGEKPFTCEQCDRRFNKPSNLRRHMDIHIGVKAHKCEQCDRRFTDSSSLRRHMDIHNGVKAHKCVQCDRRFTQAACLRRHVAIHSGVKAHKCEQCDGRFNDASNLRRHMDIHNEIKAHKCEQCDRRFTQASALRTHMDIHIGVKAHKCKQCDRLFTRATNLRRHMLIHDRESPMVHKLLCS